MKFLFYKIRLAFNLCLFILSLSANFSNKTKPLILSVFVVGLLAIITGISLLNNHQTPTQIIAVSTVVPKNLDLYTSKNLKKNELENEIIFWENAQKVQPYSRDVLINLSHLYSALQLDEKAAEYKNKAVEIDPNNPLFK